MHENVGVRLTKRHRRKENDDGVERVISLVRYTLGQTDLQIQIYGSPITVPKGQCPRNESGECAA